MAEGACAWVGALLCVCVCACVRACVLACASCVRVCACVCVLCLCVRVQRVRVRASVRTARYAVATGAARDAAAHLLRVLKQLGARVGRRERRQEPRWVAAHVSPDMVSPC